MRAGPSKQSTIIGHKDEGEEIEATPEPGLPNWLRLINGEGFVMQVQEGVGWQRVAQSGGPGAAGLSAAAPGTSGASGGKKGAHAGGIMVEVVRLRCLVELFQDQVQRQAALFQAPVELLLSYRRAMGFHEDQLAKEAAYWEGGEGTARDTSPWALWRLYSHLSSLSLELEAFIESGAHQPVFGFFAEGEGDY